MNIGRIKKLVKMYNNMDDKEFFASLVVFNTIDFLDELDEFSDGDIEYLEKLYRYYLKSDINLTNVDLLMEMFEDKEKLK